MKKIFFILFFICNFANATVVDDLNKRFHNTVDSCGSDLPAYYCSGVLIRATGDSEGYYPWNPSPSAVNLGSVSFSYLRNDMKINSLWKNNGFIFKQQSTAEAEGTAIKYRCSYPYEALSADRGRNGCGAILTEDENNCATLGVSALYQWSDFLIQKNTNIQTGQCSFDANKPLEFILSIKSHDVGRFDLSDNILLGYGEKYNEVLLETWEQNQAVPLEAFWYISGDNDALDNALYDRERYFDATGILVDVVELDLNNLQTPFVGAL